MKRALIQLEEELYEVLRRRAFQEKRSVSSVIREILKKDVYSARQVSSPISIRQYRFVASGKSKQKDLKPVSERHDEALSVAFKK